MDSSPFKRYYRLRKASGAWTNALILAESAVDAARQWYESQMKDWRRDPYETVRVETTGEVVYIDTPYRHDGLPGHWRLLPKPPGKKRRVSDRRAKTTNAPPAP